MRVVRFDPPSEPEPHRAAPVARLDEDPVERSEPVPDETGMFDQLDAPPAAPVAVVGALEPDGTDADAAATPVAGIADLADSADLANGGGVPAPVFRAAEITNLAPDGRGGRRSPATEPGGRRTQRDTAPARPARRAADGSMPGDGDVPSHGNEQTTGDKGRRRGRSGERGARPGGGFGSRGRPAELDPDADPIAVAKEICLRLLADRARTRQELAQALTRKGVPDEAAGSVLERFDEVGLIDDAAFAGQWVRSRHHHRGLARRAIAMELRRKGVDDEVAGEALEEVDQESEERRARELVDRKLRTVPADTPEQRQKAATRLVGMLARKGYGGGVAYRVVREALAAHGAEIDELGTDPID